MENNAPQYSCSAEVTLDVIGGKWKGIILALLAEQPRRFNELRRELPAITHRMLTLQLRELEADGIVHREIYQQIPPKVEYSLTEFGATLKPILLALQAWGDRYMDQVIEKKARKAPPVCLSKPEALNSKL
uniref:Putative HTH-type transcriptional regulator YdeP n=1 Tax=Thermosporothrix sp. COM3 TaxID=2490863 RepID=A0A455SSJ3_9CHLR|nr:putative HTH-type transcriptional regulator YdeP [Thermosporothrix sp. COM3]